MAFAGLRKQINKANQYVTEKIGGAEGTKLDEDFTDMERKTDLTNELVEELQLKTKEFLQPNPTVRAKMAAVKGISKLSGQAKAQTYPQPEGTLGECMLTYGRKMGDDSMFGQSLVETGEALKQMADVKYSLDDNMKQNFLEPLHHLQTKDLKEVMHHRKKLQGRRLDYDCKKRRKDKERAGATASPSRSPKPKGSHITEEELKLAEDKFAESLHLTQMGMHNLLENDVEQISQLASFTEALLEYHRQCTDILQVITEKMLDKKTEAAARPRKDFTPKTLDVITTLNVEGVGGRSPSPCPSPARSPAQSPTSTQPPSSLFPTDYGNNFNANAASPLPSPMKSPNKSQPCAQALYDFEAMNQGELEFKEGETIQLLNQVDENWFEGSLNGKTGLFPVTYATVLVPLP